MFLYCYKNIKKCFYVYPATYNADHRARMNHHVLGLFTFSLRPALLPQEDDLKSANEYEST